MGQKFAEQFLPINVNVADFGLDQALGKRFADFPILLHQNLFGFRMHQIMQDPLTDQKFGIKDLFKLFAPYRYPLDIIKGTQQFFARQAQGLQQGGDRKLAPPVDTDIEDILDVEFKIYP